MTREFKGWHMAAIIVSFFAVTVAVNLTLAYFARSSFPGLVVSNSYVASQSFNRDLAIARRQHAMGWRLKVDANRGSTAIRILDRADKPIVGLRVRAVVQRPASGREDRNFELRESAPGLYSASPLGGGAWLADITVEGGPEAMRFVERIVVK